MDQKKKKKSLHLKVHLHLKSTSKGWPLIPMHFCYRKPVSMMCLGMEAAAGQWQREGLQPPAWCSFTFPLPELHSVISYCVAFDDWVRKISAMQAVTSLPAFFPVTEEFILLYFLLTTWRKPVKLNLKQNIPFIGGVCCVSVARMLNDDLRETCLGRDGEPDGEVKWEGALTALVRNILLMRISRNDTRSTS